MTYPINRRAVEAADLALYANEQALRLEEDMEPGVRVWHLVLSLLEYCDNHHLDFDGIVGEVREDESTVRF